MEPVWIRIYTENVIFGTVHLSANIYSKTDLNEQKMNYNKHLVT